MPAGGYMAVATVLRTWLLEPVTARAPTLPSRHSPKPPRRTAAVLQMGCQLRGRPHAPAQRSSQHPHPYTHPYPYHVRCAGDQLAGGALLPGLMSVIGRGLADPAPAVRSAAVKAAEPLVGLVEREADVVAFHQLVGPLLEVRGSGGWGAEGWPGVRRAHVGRSLLVWRVFEGAEWPFSSGWGMRPFLSCCWAAS